MTDNGSTRGTPPGRHGLIDEVYECANAVLDGRASDAERSRLEELVCRNEEARRAYLQFMQETVAIRQALAVQSRCVPLSPPDLEACRAPHFARRRFSGRSVWWTAGVGIVLSLALLAFFTGRNAPPQGSPLRRVARIQQSTGAIWKGSDGWLDLNAGDWLDGGRYQLTKGVAQLQFPWGTEVTLEAPTEIEFAADGSRRLWQGQLVAKVSAEDTGFAIDTPSVKIVDLGTEFGVSAAANGESEVHVFKGSVEARARYGVPAEGSPPILLAAGQATIFARDGDAVQEIRYNPRRFLRAWQVANRIARTDGSARFAHPPPPSVVEGRTESNEQLLLFLERESVTLPTATGVSFTHPELYTSFGDQMAWLPAHVEVDSYLIHFDPVGRPGEAAPVTVKGAVTFDRPIVGVIAHGDLLGETDAILAAPNTEYVAATQYTDLFGRGYLANALPPYVSRGLTGIGQPKQNLRRSTASNDFLRLSQDRRTLTIACTGDGAAEQIRVLVAAREDALPLAPASPPVGQSRPFYGRPHAVTERIQAEDFDLGGPRIGYQDNTPDLMANAYRTRESVEIYSYLRSGQPDQLADPVDQVVCFTRAGEWMNYTLHIPAGGEFVVQAHVASWIGGGRFRCDFGEAAATEPITVPRTLEEEPAYRLDAFVTVESNPVSLPAGTLVMRVVMEREHDTGWVGDFDWFRVVPASSAGPTPPSRAFLPSAAHPAE